MFLRISFYFLLVHISTAQLSNFFWTNDDFSTFYDVTSTTPDPDFAQFNQKESSFFINYKQITNDSKIEESVRNPDKQIKKKGNKSNSFSNSVLKNYNLAVWSNVKKGDTEKFDQTNGKFVAKFPEETIEWFDTSNVTSNTTLDVVVNNNNNKTQNITGQDVTTRIKKSYEEKLLENICKFMTERNCSTIRGYPNTGITRNFTQKGTTVQTNETLICCILPLKNLYHNNLSRNITRRKVLPEEFIESSESVERPKRSEDIAQKQRNILLKRKYAHPNHKSLDTNVHKKTDLDYEYDDPYWNIKTMENAKRQKQNSIITRYNVNADDYREEYAAELPRPSLSSLSSDNVKKHAGWTVSHPNKGVPYDGADDYDSDDTGYMRSTIDPRTGNEKRRKASPYMPLKITRTTAEPSEDQEIQTAVNVNYQTHPETSSAVQEFQLLNFLKKSKKTFEPSSHLPPTVETVLDDETSDGDHFDGNQDTSSEDFKERQIFKGCGKSLRSIPAAMKKIDKQIADTENGSHPWMGLLVPTRKLNNLLCYASLIHPRAALSAADCVHRSSPREVTLIVGLWNLNERSRLKSRIVTVYLHPKYNGGLSNNLALLHWKRPLRLGVNVHPVCLSNPRLGAECLFVGWGGFDQGIHSRSRWQRATIHTCNDHLSLNGVNVPPEAFCASVEASNTVTGFGGSLVCSILGHLSAVGVAISRDSALVLLPAHDWIVEAIGVLQE